MSFQAPNYSAEIATDDWLSQLIRKSAWRVSVRKAQDAAGRSDELERCLARSDSFLYSKVPVRDVSAAHFLQQAGFLLIDTNVLLERKHENARKPKPGVHARFAVPADRAEVECIASSAFVYSRFHLDPRFDQATANRVKTAWAGNFFAGQRGDHMVVAEVDRKVAGFLQLIKTKDQKLVIDLIATDRALQGRGVATSMIAFAEREIAGMNSVLVGTQLANAPSISFYEAYGFRVREASYVFHYHGAGR